MPATVAGAGEVQLDSGPTLQRRDRGAAAGRALPRGGAAGEAADRGACERGAAPRNGLPRVEGIVESSLYLGTATQIAVDLGDDVRMTVLVPNASEAERQRLPGGGARVGLSWEPEHMHVVRESPSDRTSEQRGRAGAGDELETTREGESDGQQ